MKCGVTALDGAYDSNADRLVFSDLEQTKGYEFEYLIIVNCCRDVLPALDAPLEEAFRDLCKLYVAMTRSKRELILSFHGSASEWINAVSSTISMDYWSSFETMNVSLLQGVPKVLAEADPNVPTDSPLALSGTQFVYTSSSLGLSLDALEKIAEIVDGKGLTRGGTGRRLKWPTMSSLVADLNESQLHDGLVGLSVAEEIRNKVDGLQGGQ